MQIVCTPVHGQRTAGDDILHDVRAHGEYMKSIVPKAKAVAGLACAIGWFATVVPFGMQAHATVLTFVTTPQAGAPVVDDSFNGYDPTIWDPGAGSDTVVAPLFTAPGAGGFSDYGNN